MCDRQKEQPVVTAADRIVGLAFGKYVVTSAEWQVTADGEPVPEAEMF